MFGRKTEPVRQSDFEMFTIFDSKTGSYEIPSFAINHHDMVRQVLNMFKDPAQRNNRFLVNAEDYSIFRVGNFCKKSGTLQSINPEHIANLHDLRALAQPSVQESSWNTVENRRQAVMTQATMEAERELRQ